MCVCVCTCMCMCVRFYDVYNFIYMSWLVGGCSCGGNYSHKCIDFNLEWVDGADAGHSVWP